MIYPHLPGVDNLTHDVLKAKDMRRFLRILLQKQWGKMFLFKKKKRVSQKSETPSFSQIRIV